MTLWPSVKAAQLYDLVYYRGDVRDIAMPMSIEMLLDPVEMRQNARWRRAYLGRYLRFQPSEIDAMSRIESDAYVKLAAEFIKLEAGKAPATFEDL